MYRMTGQSLVALLQTRAGFLIITSNTTSPNRSHSGLAMLGAQVQHRSTPEPLVIDDRCAHLPGLSPTPPECPGGLGQAIEGVLPEPRPRRHPQDAPGTPVHKPR